MKQTIGERVDATIETGKEIIHLAPWVWPYAALGALDVAWRGLTSVAHGAQHVLGALLHMGNGEATTTTHKR